MTIGERIKNTRIKKGITQKELADRLRTSPQNLSQYENGKRKPKLDTLRKISQALEVKVSDLIGNWDDYSSDEFANDFISGIKTPEELIEAEDVYKYLLSRYKDKYPVELRIKLALDELTNDGKEKVACYAEDLSKIPEYRQDQKPGGPDPDQEAPDK